MAGYDRGNIDIDEISGSSIVNFGGALVISPKLVSKSAYGAGSNNTAVFAFTLTDTSSTNAISIDGFDQLVSGNI